MKAFYVVRRHRPMAPVFQTKLKPMFSDQYEVVQAFDNPAEANAVKEKLEARGRRFKYSIGRIAL